MSTISPPVRGKTWVFQVTALCIVLGMLLALSLKTQRQAVNQGLPTTVPALRSAYRLMKQQNQQIERDLGDYKARYERLAAKQGGRGSTRDIQRIIDENKMIAGMVAVHGPGIVIQLQDSPKRPAEAAPEVMSDYIVHDRDIRDVVNELFDAGAEAISVNGQRLIASSSIRCVGSVVLVNRTALGAPFIIKAVGAPETLESGIRMPGGIYDDLFAWDMILIKREKDIRVPAYTGSTRLNYAIKDPRTGN
jgi:uncharacterized protein YlxW (UPF0749 family)